MKEFFSKLNTVGAPTSGGGYDPQLKKWVSPDQNSASQGVAARITDVTNAGLAGLEANTQQALQNSQGLTDQSVTEMKQALAASIAKGMPQSIQGLNALTQQATLLGLPVPQGGFAALAQQEDRQQQFDVARTALLKAAAPGGDLSNLGELGGEITPEIKRLAVHEQNTRILQKQRDAAIAKRDELKKSNDKTAAEVAAAERDFDALATAMTGVVAGAAQNGQFGLNGANVAKHNTSLIRANHDNAFLGKDMFSISKPDSLKSSADLLEEFKSKFSEAELTSPAIQEVLSNLQQSIKSQEGISQNSNDQRNILYNKQILSTYLGAPGDSNSTQLQNDNREIWSIIEQYNGGVVRPNASDTAAYMKYASTPDLPPEAEQQIRDIITRSNLGNGLGAGIGDQLGAVSGDVADAYISGLKYGDPSNLIDSHDFQNLVGRAIGSVADSRFEGLSSGPAATFNTQYQDLSKISSAIQSNANLNSETIDGESFSTLGRDLLKAEQGALAFASNDAVSQVAMAELPNIPDARDFNLDEALQQLENKFVGEEIGFSTDPGNQQSALDALRDTPGYQFALDQGQRSTERSAAARGNLLSGQAQKELTLFGQGLADQTFQQTLQNLQGVIGVGAGFDQQAAQNTLATGQQVGNILGQQNVVQSGLLQNLGNQQVQSAGNVAGLLGQMHSGSVAASASQAASNTAAATAKRSQDLGLIQGLLGSGSNFKINF